ncbi:hypothetical protein [Synechococcus sp. CC9616]|uniref:hypothetical protein n=1 Tax=Synechococcus sp. CC9616 TaxID=110663 RepID=UPI00048F68CA|nr:hypothetical protein [Synechococcus sp. CC9616]
MKLIPLIGALLISAVPVQAFETYEELVEACGATEEIGKLCGAVADYSAAMMTVSLLCDLEEKSRLTKENLVLSWDEWNLIVDENYYSGDTMWNVGAEITLKNLPECSI